MSNEEIMKDVIRALGFYANPDTYDGIEVSPDPTKLLDLVKKRGEPENNLPTSLLDDLDESGAPGKLAREVLTNMATVAMARKVTKN